MANSRTQQQPKVRFYPNPATSVVNFELPQGGEKVYTLQLYNFIGKKVAEVIPNSPRIVFSLSGFTRGIYIYQLRDQYGRVLDSGKIQVVR